MRSTFQRSSFQPVYYTRNRRWRPQPPLAWGVPWAREIGFFTDAASGAATITSATGINNTSGQLLVVMGAADNTGASGIATTVTVTDNASGSGSANVWTTLSPQAIADPGAASAGQQGFIAYCRVTKSFNGGDVITITF